MLKPNKSEAGFSLVAILVVMAVVLASILMISQAKFQQQGTQKALKVKQSYTDVNQSLITDVVSKLHTQLKASATCPTPNAVFTNLTLSGDAKYSASQTINVTSGAPAVHSDAAKRCSGKVDVPGTGGNRYHFCVKLQPDTSAPKDSILNSKLAFAEFAIELIDLQTQAAITCQVYNTKANDPRDGSAGMAVTMALYWENAVGAGKKSTFSQKALSYIANQNN